MFDIKQNRWKIFTIISLLGFFADWFTKYLANTRLRLYECVPVIGELLQFQLIFNKGFIFGMNPQSIFPSFPVNLIFLIFSIIAMILLIIYHANIEPNALFSYFAIPLIMAGALGNLFDRIIRPNQGVVDFIRFDLNFRPFDPWPIFNVADAFICVGVVLIILDLFLIEKKSKKKLGEEKKASS